MLLWGASTLVFLGLIVAVILRNQTGFQSNKGGIQQDNSGDINFSQRQTDVKMLPKLKGTNLPPSVVATSKPQNTLTSNTEKQNLSLIHI